MRDQAGSVNQGGADTEDGRNPLADDAVLRVEQTDPDRHGDKGRQACRESAAASAAGCAWASLRR